MATLTPTVNYKTMTDKDMAEKALAVTQAAFEAAIAEGLLSGDSLAIQVGAEDDFGHFEMIAQKFFGPDAEQFLANTDVNTGKLATVLRYNQDSIEAVQEHGDEIPEGPQSWTGGVCYEARVFVPGDGWLTRIFYAAASGVQGHFDMSHMYTLLTFMGGMWAQKMQAKYNEA